MKSLFHKLACLLILSSPAGAESFHLDPSNGSDKFDGKSVEQAWKTLSRPAAESLRPGDEILLKRGGRFAGGLSLSLQGTAAQPIVIGAYGKGSPPIIDAAGHIAGVHLKNSHHVIVKDLNITADGGKTKDGSDPGYRYGVSVQAGKGYTSHVSIENMEIHNIYPEVARKHEGKNPKTWLGTAIAIEGGNDAISSDFMIRNCRISETGFKAIGLGKIQHVEILDNRMTDIGGPAIQPGRVSDLVVRGNTVIRSGSSLDPRMHGRGSGIWPWTCQRVLIEKNIFMHARGKGDSCGIHIDYNCRDVVVQYNLSADNEGGFAEILGNNHNCAYRYNISVNDGFRVKKQNGAIQDGKLLMTSGYVGGHGKKHGPYNTYIYNNTIFVREDSRSCFSIAPSTEGLLIANNIFQVLGKTIDVLDDQDKRKDGRASAIKRSLVSNNLYVTANARPPHLPFKDVNSFIGNADFLKPGGFAATDYIPRNAALVKDAGIEIAPLPEDATGLRIGLKVEKDFLGNPITGKPDLGAIEIQASVQKSP